VTSPIEQALDRVYLRITGAARRAGRDPAAVCLVAVTKGVDVDRIAEVIAAGVNDIGENRVQEAEQKFEHLPRGVTRHLIGHLQTNKARRAAELFDIVHSIDSDRVVATLAQHRPATAAALSLLIEVDLTGIPGRSGVPDDEVDGLARTIAGIAGVELVGLMTIAPPGESPEASRPYFTRLSAIRDRVQQSSGMELRELSMGMSDDFEVAIEEGATIVRIGRAIFGDRSE
jgi:pyridoxal phosphate enzyme (YggS family)